MINLITLVYIKYHRLNDINQQQSRTMWSNNLFKLRFTRGGYSREFHFLRFAVIGGSRCRTLNAFYRLIIERKASFAIRLIYAQLTLGNVTRYEFTRVKTTLFKYVVEKSSDYRVALRDVYIAKVIYTAAENTPIRGEKLHPIDSLSDINLTARQIYCDFVQWSRRESIAIVWFNATRANACSTRAH